MKTYTIEVCAFGTFWEADVNCPPGWYGSGCYDVEYELHQEADFLVVADSLENALKLIDEKFRKFQGDEYSYTVTQVCYNPDSIEVREADDDDSDEEIIDYYYFTPEEGLDGYENYKEI